MYAISKIITTENKNRHDKLDGRVPCVQKVGRRCSRPIIGCAHQKATQLYKTNVLMTEINAKKDELTVTLLARSTATLDVCQSQHTCTLYSSCV